jgi:hypothetical protein
LPAISRPSTAAVSGSALCSRATACCCAAGVCSSPLGSWRVMMPVRLCSSDSYSWYVIAEDLSGERSNCSILRRWVSGWVGGGRRKAGLAWIHQRSAARALLSLAAGA